MPKLWSTALERWTRVQMVLVKNSFISFSDESFRKCTICPRVQPVSAVKEDHVQNHVFWVRTQSLSEVGATLNLGRARSGGEGGLKHSSLETWKMLQHILSRSLMSPGNIKSSIAFRVFHFPSFCPRAWIRGGKWLGATGRGAVAERWRTFPCCQGRVCSETAW